MSSRRRKELAPPLPNTTELDKRFIATLEAGKDEKKKLLTLYGGVTSVTHPLKVTAHGTCLNAGRLSATAGAATYWGPNAPFNLSARVHGLQTGPRAELMALILALEIAPTFRSLTISTRSQYAIRSAVYYASKNEACGWRNTNGDLTKILVSLIKLRSAPVHFQF
ncbi:hypothetical protein C8R45DRAFT_838577, partial [Mycena sanguinolenta]